VDEKARKLKLGLNKSEDSGEQHNEQVVTPT